MSVRDNVERKTVVVRKGKRYLARAAALNPTYARSRAGVTGLGSLDGMLRRPTKLTLAAARAGAPGTGDGERGDVHRQRTDDIAGAAGCPAVCTVRNAISAAAANNTTDDIVAIPAGTYSLNPVFGTLTVPNDATRITIQGAGANSTIIQADVEVPFRVLTLGPAPRSCVQRRDAAPRPDDHRRRRQRLGAEPVDPDAQPRPDHARRRPARRRDRDPGRHRAHHLGVA